MFEFLRKIHNQEQDHPHLREAFQNRDLQNSLGALARKWVVEVVFVDEAMVHVHTVTKSEKTFEYAFIDRTTALAPVLSPAIAPISTEVQFVFKVKLSKEGEVVYAFYRLNEGKRVAQEIVYTELQPVIAVIKIAAFKGDASVLLSSSVRG